MSYIILSTDGNEPVTLEQVKAHLRVDIDDEDTLIETYMEAARAHCERFLGLSLVPQTIKATYRKSQPEVQSPLVYRSTWGQFRDCMWSYDPNSRKRFLPLPLSPVAELVSVKDQNGEDFAHEFDEDSIPAVLTLDDMPDKLIVEYKTSAYNFTPQFKLAILMLVHQMYQQRGEVGGFVDSTAIVRVEEAYLRPYRVQLGMA
jgi:hypothetical protein